MTFQIDLGEDAEADIDDILEWSVTQVGEAVRDGYQALIEATFASIARDPAFPGTHDRRDLGSDMRIVHLRACRNEIRGGARRIANPRHFVVYRQSGEFIHIVRLLHEEMDISPRRIAR